jgi:hypothetical protein
MYFFNLNPECHQLRYYWLYRQHCQYQLRLRRSTYIRPWWKPTCMTLVSVTKRRAPSGEKPSCSCFNRRLRPLHLYVTLRASQVIASGHWNSWINALSLFLNLSWLWYLEFRLFKWWIHLHVVNPWLEWKALTSLGKKETVNKNVFPPNEEVFSYWLKYNIVLSANLKWTVLNLNDSWYCFITFFCVWRS